MNLLSRFICIWVVLFYCDCAESECGMNETNHTVQVPCQITKQENETQYRKVWISPDCSFVEELVNLFIDICTAKFSIQSFTAVVNKTMSSYCYPVMCCPGYVMSGDICVTGCPNGTFGENCTKNCSCPESAYSQCDKESGNCTCLPGLMGDNCTEPCQDGYYGDDCRYKCGCHGNASCDKQTGQCNCTEPGWTGICCNMECYGTFGLNCSENCTCNRNQTCDPVNGNCRCKPGRGGSNCSSECDEWRYGADCLYNCSCDMNTTKFCDKENGICQCLPGFIGENCSDACPMGFFGNDCTGNCSCVGTPYCDHINGTCICLGNRGENCSEACSHTQYGPDCSRNCSCSDGNYNGSCDSISGACYCKTGRITDDCSVKDNKDGHTDAQENMTPGNTNMMDNDLMIAVIVGSCGFLIVAIIVVIVCIQRRRKQKCFDSQNAKQYNNAAYSDNVTSDALVLSGLDKQHQGEDRGNEMILKDKADDTAILEHLDEVKNVTETPTGDDKNVEMKEVTKVKINIPINTRKTSVTSNTESVDEASESKKQDPQEKHMTHEIAQGESEILPGTNTDDNSDHYSDIDSLKDEKEQRYSFVEVDKNDSLDELMSGQEIPDEEPYDSLENNTDVKKLVSLPNYSSFEEVRKEILNENQEETDDPYDKLFLTNQSKKKTLTRNDYNTFNITNKTFQEDLNEESHDNLGNTAVDKKSSINDISSNIKPDLFRPESENDDTEYNSLDHTGKSFRILNASDNVYHTNEMLKPNTNTPLDSGANGAMKIETKMNTSIEVVPEMDGVLTEEPEYNKLDHTGKSFRGVESHVNVYDTNKSIDTGSNNPVRKLSKLKMQTHIEDEFSERQNPDANDTDAADDSEYNCLDHTGKSFRTVKIPDNIYHNKMDPWRKESNKSASSVDIDIPYNNEEEEDSYSFCEIDDADVEHREKHVTDDDAFIYEIPDDELDKSDTQGTIKHDEKLVSKTKLKAKQRQIDDYEHYELTFGNSPS